MSRSRLMDELTRVMRIGRFCDARGLDSREGVEMANDLERRARSRRDFLKGMGAAAAAGAMLGGSRTAWAGKPTKAAPRIAIVGGGLAGLTCADALGAKGYKATIYEAATRVGGRCWSLRGFFPGQTAELGGELVDNLHKTMLGYTNAFNLAKEDLYDNPGGVLYRYAGQTYDESSVVDEFRILSARMGQDLQASSGSPTFFNNTPADIALDNTDLATYLATRAPDLPLIRFALSEAYTAEYGLEPSQQSCLGLLLFIHVDRRSKFRPFGIFSNERYHLTDGNDGIVQGIAAKLPGPIELGKELTSLRKNAAGEFELSFKGQKTAVKADFVVLTVPFSILRNVGLDASLGLSKDKLRAINTLGYGMNAKTMIGFDSRPWQSAGGNGSCYTDLAHVQTVWETNPSKAGNPGGILTDYASGDRGVAIGGQSVQSQVGEFLGDLEVVFPGVQAAATKVGGSYRAVRQHWPSWAWSKGSYTCYTPGQFTQVAGLEGQAAGKLKFAGEHANSFYEWQGFMEGACLSGLDAAGQILADLK